MRPAVPVALPDSFRGGLGQSASLRQRYCLGGHSNRKHIRVAEAAPRGDRLAHGVGPVHRGPPGRVHLGRQVRRRPVRYHRVPVPDSRCRPGRRAPYAVHSDARQTTRRPRLDRMAPVEAPSRSQPGAPHRPAHHGLPHRPAHCGLPDHPVPRCSPGAPFRYRHRASCQSDRTTSPQRSYSLS